MIKKCSGMRVRDTTRLRKCACDVFIFRYSPIWGWKAVQVIFTNVRGAQKCPGHIPPPRWNVCLAFLSVMRWSKKNLSTSVSAISFAAFFAASCVIDKHAFVESWSRKVEVPPARAALHWHLCCTRTAPSRLRPSRHPCAQGRQRGLTRTGSDS